VITGTDPAQYPGICFVSGSDAMVTKNRLHIDLDPDHQVETWSRLYRLFAGLNCATTDAGILPLSGTGTLLALAHSLMVRESDVTRDRVARGRPPRVRRAAPTYLAKAFRRPAAFLLVRSIS